MGGPKASTEYRFCANLKGAFRGYHMKFLANIHVTFLPSATRPTALQCLNITIKKRSNLPVGGLAVILAIISSSVWANSFAKSPEPRPKRKKMNSRLCDQGWSQFSPPMYHNSFIRDWPNQKATFFFRILMVIIHQLEIPSRYFRIAKTAPVAKKNWRIINKRISVWRENYARIFVLGYYLFLKLGTDIIRDKYPSIQVFSYQMEANIYLLTASLQGQGQVTPTQMSTSGPQYAFPSKSSGAAYGGLPHQVLRCFPSWNMLLNPKSVKMKK